MGLFKRFLGEKDPATETNAPAGAARGVQPQHVTGEEFDDVVLKSALPTVVDFWAEWCGPCHMISPAVQQLANEFEGRLQVAKLNADDYPEILGRYGIMGIPTLIFFKDGQEVDRIVGLQGYNVLKSKAARLLA
jgi:thioredoxin 1